MTTDICRLTVLPWAFLRSFLLSLSSILPPSLPKFLCCFLCFLTFFLLGCLCFTLLSANAISDTCFHFYDQTKFITIIWTKCSVNFMCPFDCIRRYPIFSVSGEVFITRIWIHTLRKADAHLWVGLIQPTEGLKTTRDLGRRELLPLLDMPG